MMIRLLHLLIGHQWAIDSVTFNNRIGVNVRTASGFVTDDIWMCLHGFTVVARSCHCGARHSFKLIGDHATDPKIEELRRMIK